MKKRRRSNGEKRVKWIAVPIIAALFVTGCSKGNEPGKQGSDATNAGGDKPATWIADRELTGLVFMSGDDVSKEMNPEIAAELKKRTGITLKLEVMNADHSIDGLIAGLASNDLPDFIVYYLNNSGRPEMSVILKAAREDMFTDLSPLIKDTKVYSNYLQDGYLPADTQYGVMFRPEFNGSSYFMHMNIQREGGYEENRYVGGPYIRKDIAEALEIDPRTITTSEQLYDLAKKIKDGGFKDNNGKDVMPIGPKYWGNSNTEAGPLLRDLTWGATDQGFSKDSNGNIVHESKTEYMMKRIEFVQKLLQEKLMPQDFYTMPESKATEGAINGTYAIISDMHNYLPFNKDVHYLPLGPAVSANGKYTRVTDFKSGYAAWSVPKTTKNPQDIVKFADYLATREGKLLWMYGLEGRDYTLDEKGNPLVNKEVLELKQNDPKAAKALGFDGVDHNWGYFLGSTDLNRLGDFGEMQFGDNVMPEANAAANQIAEYWEYDKKKEEGIIVDGYRPVSFFGEFSDGTSLKTALSNYSESMVRAFYMKNGQEAQKIMDAAIKQLSAAGLDDYEKLLDEKDKDPKTKIIVE